MCIFRLSYEISYVIYFCFFLFTFFVCALTPCYATNKDMYSNVVSVEWYGGSIIGQESRGYLQAAVNTKVIGTQICSVVKAIRHDRPEMKFHLIGFSLGGHVSGFAGKDCKNDDDGSPIIDKITGKCACVICIFNNNIACCVS